MFRFLKRLFFGGSVDSVHGGSNTFFNPLLVGVWAPVEGNPKETFEYRADGTMRALLFGGILPRDGRYKFVSQDVLQIDWLDKPSGDAQAMLGTVNERLADQGQGVQVRAHQQSVLQVEITQTELRTLHIEKQRRSHFRRIS